MTYFVTCLADFGHVTEALKEITPWDPLQRRAPRVPRADASPPPAPDSDPLAAPRLRLPPSLLPTLADLHLPIPSVVPNFLHDPTAASSLTSTTPDRGLLAPGPPKRLGAQPIAIGGSHRARAGRLLLALRLERVETLRMKRRGRRGAGVKRASVCAFALAMKRSPPCLHRHPLRAPASCCGFAVVSDAQDRPPPRRSPTRLLPLHPPPMSPLTPTAVGFPTRKTSSLPLASPLSMPSRSPTRKAEQLTSPCSSAMSPPSISPTAGRTLPRASAPGLALHARAEPPVPERGSRAVTARPPSSCKPELSPLSPGAAAAAGRLSLASSRWGVSSRGCEGCIVRGSLSMRVGAVDGPVRARAPAPRVGGAAAACKSRGDLRASQRPASTPCVSTRPDPICCPIGGGDAEASSRGQRTVTRAGPAL
ncbi:hypothetical protein FB451DRAFT_1439337 [Mycena latifolia]|nr:hypothetical protein FB451DRAFT_1439337 [Mycena latifolia]